MIIDPRLSRLDREGPMRSAIAPLPLRPRGNAPTVQAFKPITKETSADNAAKIQRLNELMGSPSVSIRNMAHQIARQLQMIGII